MAALVAERESNPWYKRLFLPAYRVGEAARYAGVNPQTVAAWHYWNSPVLLGCQPKRPLAYLELVEVAFVAFFRRLGVPMQRIRQTREYVAKTFDFDYPFAEFTFKTEGCHILMDHFSTDPEGAPDAVIVADAAGQLAWGDLLKDKFAQFDYELELALTWYPAGRESAVKIDPRIAFGKPIVEGIPTAVIKGRWAAGESLQHIGEDFHVSEQAILDALKFERVEVDGHGFGQ